MKILVTGANGFLGSALCEYLDGKGVNVQRGVRCNIVAKTNQSDHVIGDINATTDWSNALQGIDTVVHLAAHVHVMTKHADDPLKQFRKVNTEGTENLARQAAEIGVRRFIYLSSIGVNGYRTTGRQKFTELDVPAPYDPYTISKKGGEDALRTVCENSGMEYVIIRAPMVYGPGCVGNLPRLMALINKRVPMPFGAIKNARSMIYIDNLVEAIDTCIKHQAAADQLFLVSDQEEISTPELIRKLAEFMHLKPRLVNIPLPILDLLASLPGKSQDIRKLKDSLVIDSSKISALLSWQPTINIFSGLQRTAEWYVS